MKLNRYIDHTILKANATESDVVQLCEEARQHEFFSVCINSAWVPTARKLLAGSPVKVCSVIGFPLGAMSTAAKVFEARQAVADGADEIDMVINVGRLKDGKDDAVREEISAIKTAIGTSVLKVIIETCYLTDAEKVRACELSVAAGADFVKTSTGFGTGGATATLGPLPAFQEIRLWTACSARSSTVTFRRANSTKTTGWSPSTTSPRRHPCIFWSSPRSTSPR